MSELSPTLTALKGRLKACGLKWTPPRCRILAKLAAARTPASIADLHSALADSCSLTTVFRALRQFEQAGIVRACQLGTREFLYELADPAPCSCHHHHLVCKACRRVVPVDACCVDALEKKLERQHGFASITHTLEFYGLCAVCQKETPSPHDAH